MFGKHKPMLEGKAKILLDEGTTDHGGMVGDPTMHVKYVVEVQPETGPPFRAETKAKELAYLPGVGDVLKARYDLESQKVELQIEGDPRYDSKVRNQATKARRDELLGGGSATQGSAGTDEFSVVNQQTEQAIEKLAEAKKRGAPQSELDELTRLVEEGMEKQEELLSRKESGGF